MSKIIKEMYQAIIGTEHDYTKGNIYRAIIILAIPIIIEMGMEAVFAVVDIYFVEKLGPSAVATVGLTESVMMIIYSVAMGLGVAATSLVSRRIGEKNKFLASRVAFQSIVLGLMVSLFIAILGVLFSEDILRLMNGSEEVVQHGAIYTKILLGSNSIIMMLFIINAVFRAAGDAIISMVVLVIANAINIVLDPCLILGLGPFPEMGIVGAAVATTIGRGTGVLIQLYLLFFGSRRIKLAAKHMVVKLKTMITLLRLSVGAIGQHLIATSSWLFLYSIIGRFGDESVAGYTIGIRILIFSLLPAWGISNAAATLVGQNLGANQPKRAEKSVWITAFFNAGLMVITAIVFIITPRTFISIFTDNPDVIDVGISCLRILSYGYLFYAFGMIMPQAFNGAGDTRTPMLINIICFYAIEIPLAWALAIPLGMNEIGVFVSVIIAESIIGISSTILFKRGKWKLQKV